MANWLDKYNDGGPVQENYNDAQASVGPEFVGLGYNTKGRNYSPAWGGQFQDGGFLQPTSYKLPPAANEGAMSTEKATSIGGEKGEPAYLIPTFKYGKPLKDPVAEFKKTGEHLGGPFKTWQEAEKFGEMRHQYVEQGRNIPSPLKWWGEMAMGGSIPGAVGFTYARTRDAAPSNGKYAKKTKASAQNGMEMKFYQEGLDWKPKSISQNGKRIPTIKEISQMPDKKYQPSDAVMDTKAVLAGLSMIPMAGYPANIASSVYDLGTGLKYAADQQWDKAKEDLISSGLNILPTAGIYGALAGMGKLQKAARARAALRTAKIANDIKDITSAPGTSTIINRGTGYVQEFDKAGNELSSRGPRSMQEVKSYNQKLKGQYRTGSTSDVPEHLRPFESPEYAKGGVIKDDRGQWAHPGEVTEIGSNEITMQGVDYPVLGISDTGDTKLMQPGKDYKFKGKKVTEYPTGAWLDKYK